MKTKFELSEIIEKIFATNSQQYSEWFGYYNYDTLNYDQTKMLCNRAKFDGVAPQKGMEIELGYYDLLDKQWYKIDDTDSWNWQQGAMLQWLPGDENRNKVIYNTSLNGHLISKIHDIVCKETKIINWPIYGITPDGKKSISLELERSYWCRAYHYQSVVNPFFEGEIIDTDGIFEIDLISNTRKRIISIEEIIQYDYKQYFADCKHWLEHIMISENGKYFCFLHRFSPKTDIYKYETRIFIADISGKHLQIIPNWNVFEWSHFGWNGDSAFAIYTVKNNSATGAYKSVERKHTDKSNIIKTIFFSSINQLKHIIPNHLKRIIKGQSSFYQYYTIDKDGAFVLKQSFNLRILNIDGHPSFTNDGKYMVTDSYPDDEGYQRLIIYNIESGKGLIVGKFYAALRKNPASCDLHPKLSRNNDYLVIDSAYDSKHHMILFKINWEKIAFLLS